jgi:Exostosin family
MRLAGVTDIFWPHATKQLWKVNGIRIHPLPLFPVVTPLSQSSIRSDSERSILYSFIGACNTYDYRESGREAILTLQDDHRSLVEFTDEWHFGREVYLSQVHGKELTDSDVKALRHREDKYRKIMSDSIFCLCPKGTGPNSIRLWEAIAHLTIPVIISDELRLPGRREDWIDTVILVPNTRESILGIPSLLRHIESDAVRLRTLRDRLEKIREMYIAKGIHHEILQFTTKPLEFLVQHHIEMLLALYSMDIAQIQLVGVKTPQELMRMLKSNALTTSKHHIFAIEDYSDFALLHYRWSQLLNTLEDSISNISYSIVSCSPQLETTSTIGKSVKQ